MKNIITFGLPILVMLLGMLGGQIHKAIRRYGIPFFSVITSLFNRKDNVKYKIKKIILLLGLIAAFSIGYGEHSWLSKWIKKEWQMRLVYAAILSVGFIIFKMWYAPLLLIPVWQIRAGGFKVGKYDFLFEDMARYLTVGILITILVR